MGFQFGFEIVICGLINGVIKSFDDSVFLSVLCLSETMENTRIQSCDICVHNDMNHCRHNYINIPTQGGYTSERQI